VIIKGGNDITGGTVAATVVANHPLIGRRVRPTESRHHAMSLKVVVTEKVPRTPEDHRWSRFSRILIIRRWAKWCRSREDPMSLLANEARSGWRPPDHPCNDTHRACVILLAAFDVHLARKRATSHDRKWPLTSVGVAGFEPTTSSSRTIGGRQVGSASPCSDVCGRASPTGAARRCCCTPVLYSSRSRPSAGGFPERRRINVRSSVDLGSRSAVGQVTTPRYKVNRGLTVPQARAVLAAAYDEPLCALYVLPPLPRPPPRQRGRT
jgi:hypothetical protein